MVYFRNDRLNVFIAGLRTDYQNAISRIRNDSGTNTVGVSLFFADIRHQTATEIATEKRHQDLVFQGIRMSLPQGKPSYLDGTLHGISFFDKHPFLGFRFRRVARCLRNDSPFSPMSVAEVFFDGTDNFGCNISGDVCRTVPGVVMCLVELPEYFGSNFVIILEYGISSQRMSGTEQRTVQLLARQDIYPFIVYQKLMLIGFQNGVELFFRKHCFLNHRSQDAECLRKVFVE